MVSGKTMIIPNKADVHPASVVRARIVTALCHTALRPKLAMKAATMGHVPREQRVGRASMKGRPIKSGDLAVPKYTPATVFRPR